MSKSTALSAGVLIFSLVLSGVAFAQEPYSVSGPASGLNVEPIPYTTAYSRYFELGWNLIQSLL